MNTLIELVRDWTGSRSEVRYLRDLAVRNTQAISAWRKRCVELERENLQLKADLLVMEHERDLARSSADLWHARFVDCGRG